MTRAKRSSIDSQFDLFLPYLADLPLRDQREMMPAVSGMLMA